jgi:hypothetical protein
VHPLPSHLALRLIDERERELRRAVDKARLRPDGRSSRAKWRDRLMALIPGRQSGSKKPLMARPEIDLRGPERPRPSSIKTRDAV